MFSAPFACSWQEKEGRQPPQNSGDAIVILQGLIDAEDEQLVSEFLNGERLVFNGETECTVEADEAGGTSFLRVLFWGPGSAYAMRVILPADEVQPSAFDVMFVSCSEREAVADLVRVAAVDSVIVACADEGTFVIADHEESEATNRLGGIVRTRSIEGRIDVRFRTNSCSRLRSSCMETD